jgi:hypothetical protein
MTNQVPEALKFINDMPELEHGIYSIKHDWDIEPYTVNAYKIQSNDVWFIMYDKEGKIFYSSNYEWTKIERIGDLPP